MFITTLTAFIAILAIFIIMLARPEPRAGHGRSGQNCPIAHCQLREAATGSSAESLPRLSRNIWARQDIARMLMTEDDYAGRISPQPVHPKSGGSA